MRILLLLLMSAVSFAGNTGLLAWGSLYADSKADNLVTSSTSRYYGIGVRVPLTLLFGSALEFGYSKLPDQKWQKSGTTLDFTSRVRYTVNSLYALSDEISLLFGVDYNNQSQSCGADCLIKQSSGRYNAHIGFDYLIPVFAHVDSGLRLLYSLRDSQEYCYADNCGETSNIVSKKYELQLLVSSSL